MALPVAAMAEGPAGMSWGLGYLENRCTHKSQDAPWCLVDHRAYSPKFFAMDNRIQSGSSTLHKLPGPG